MLVSALVDQSGRPIEDHRNVNLLEDDLEEVINTSKTRTDGARAQLETWDESASTAYKERLRKNLQYIIEHKERWTIIADSTQGVEESNPNMNICASKFP